MSRSSSAKKSKTKGLTFEELLPLTENQNNEPEDEPEEDLEEALEEDPETHEAEDAEDEEENDDDAEEKEEDYFIDDDGDDDDGLGAIDKLVNQTKEEKMKKIQDYNEKMAKRGVVYLSKVPPYMKASQVKKYFSQYGVLRIYLAPEDESKRKYRSKFGGNKRRMYTEGWIEFEDKKMAKFVAAVYNNQQVGGKKGSFYREDLWNIRYLPKFKWNNLTEKIQYDKRMRQERLKAELAQAKKSHDFYMEQVEKSKKIMGIKNYKDLKRKAVEDISEALEDNGAARKQKVRPDAFVQAEDPKDKIRRTFKQKQPKRKEE